MHVMYSHIYIYICIYIDKISIPPSPLVSLHDPRPIFIVCVVSSTLMIIKCSDAILDVFKIRCKDELAAYLPIYVTISGSCIYTTWN